MNSKQRAYLKGLAQTTQPILNIGKSSLTPEFTASVAEALEARELVKISVLKNCLDDPREIASMLSEKDSFRSRTGHRKKDCSVQGIKGT